MNTITEPENKAYVEKLQLIGGLDKFTEAYLICAIWSSHDEDNPDCEYLDEIHDLSDIESDSIRTAFEECLKFQSSALALLKDGILNGVYGLESAGHDFWLSRNGHGAGFFDRQVLIDLGIADDLQSLAKSKGERSLYIGDDGQIYHGQG